MNGCPPLGTVVYLVPEKYYMRDVDTQVPILVEYAKLTVTVTIYVRDMITRPPTLVVCFTQLPPAHQVLIKNKMEPQES